MTMTEENTAGAITITNSFEETETETTTTTTTTTTKDSGKSTGSSTRSIKTGDTTNVIPYVVLMIGALAVIAGILYWRRRRQSAGGRM